MPQLGNKDFLKSQALLSGPQQMMVPTRNSRSMRNANFAKLNITNQESEQSEPPSLSTTGNQVRTVQALKDLFNKPPRPERKPSANYLVDKYSKQQRQSRTSRQFHTLNNLVPNSSRPQMTDEKSEPPANIQNVMSSSNTQPLVTLD